ncbi:APH(3') family aminoglycoside O-phosphotransferase [Streptomyces sp. SID3343]|uniref:APH(3') family aminoglycoside O-phosphotransferase n=1 Tax=Streptomyces sp. SID3343 TaxID=2690260 RepID=UPI00136E63DF|nr:APH(3') family aminoglycoside O-phosphotransferase [Streptomyces sp. SID3343]MYW01311.1 APH(3') family aminoglycoside O-phosphotransferase [Streptomyces sp. SID3343]
MNGLRRRFSAYTWEPITVGRSGAGVYRLDGRESLYLKVAEVNAHPDSGFDLVAETARGLWLAEQGLPVAEILDHAADAAGAWLLTRAVPGRTAADPWPADRRDAVVDALADMARTLHELPVADCPFDRSLAVTVPNARHAVAAGLVDLDDVDDERRGRTAAQLLDELTATVPDDEDLVVGHGDYCPPNVLLDPDTLDVLALIDLGRLGRTDRHADPALAMRSLLDPDNPQFTPEHATRFLTRYAPDGDLDPKRIAFHCLLDEFC